MSRERKQRIAAFRKLSGYFLWISMPAIVIISLVGLIDIFIYALTPLGEFSLPDLILKATLHQDSFDWVRDVKMTLAAKFFLVFFASTVLAMVVYILICINELISCFFEGNIFNNKAVTHARKAFKMNLYLGYFLYGFQTLGVLISFFLASYGHGERILNVIASSLDFLIVIGFLSLLLWALEIGTDISEDAELTI